MTFFVKIKKLKKFLKSHASDLFYYGLEMALHLYYVQIHYDVFPPNKRRVYLKKYSITLLQ